MPLTFCVCALLLVLASRDDDPAGDTILLRGWLGNVSKTSPGPGTELQAARVIAIYLDGRFDVAPVTNGAFALEVSLGGPAGIIFVDADDRPVGYLSLGQGLETLPLTALREGVAEIDLETLTATGSVVTPGHDPLGSELPLSDADLQVLARANAYFGAVVRNADADGDGEIDFLSGRFFLLSVWYFVNGGTLGAGLTPVVIQPTSLNCSRVVLYARDANLPESVGFTGPAGSGLSETVSDEILDFDDHAIYEAPCNNVSPVPPAGEYTVSYRGSTLRLTMPGQSATPSGIVFPVPTVTLSGGELIAVDWAYQVPGNPAPPFPRAVMTEIRVQINDPGYVRLYDSPPLPATATSHRLSSPVEWANVGTLYTPYRDAHGNHILLQWYH